MQTISKPFKKVIQNPQKPVDSTGDKVIFAVPGIIRLAATTEGDDKILIDRRLRTFTHHRNKQLATYSQRLSTCKRGPGAVIR